MCRAFRAAYREGVFLSTISVHRQVQLLRLLVDVRALIRQFFRAPGPPGPGTESRCRPPLFLLPVTLRKLAQAGTGIRSRGDQGVGVVDPLAIRGSGDQVL
jgi:hypothetical protein